MNQSTHSAQSASNYITHIRTSKGVYNSYHGETILFGAQQLNDLLIPGLFHILKERSEFPEMFECVASEANIPTDYELSELIRSDKLTERLRDDLATALLFIHVWNSEHGMILDDLFMKNHETYKNFFTEVLSYIAEHDNVVKTLAKDIRYDIIQLSSYLGAYNGPISGCVYSTHQVIDGLILVYIIYLLLIEALNNVR